MAKPLVVTSDVGCAIVAGDLPALYAILRALDAAGRSKLGFEVARVLRVLRAAQFAYYDDTFAGWGSRPTEDQVRAGAIAGLVCATAQDIADLRFDIDDVLD